MNADSVVRNIAENWKRIAEALGDDRDAFERRLTPLLRQLESGDARERADALAAILALFQEFPRAEKILHEPVRHKAPASTRGPVAINSLAPGDTQERYTVVPVFYATDRAVVGPKDAPTSYSGDRGEFGLGVAQVSIPDDHRMGKIERPSIWRLEFRENPDKHVVLWNLQPLTDDEFKKRARNTLAESPKKEILLFVHGYNVTFYDAVTRTAQVAYDLHFEGLPVLYSWPSEGSFPRYTIDENNVTWTKPRFVAFLSMLREQLGADVIHIIAHSMGNRLVSETLSALTPAAANAASIHQVVMAAPDVDADTFKQLAASFQGKAERFTLYASSNDKALHASKTVHKYPRAGESGASLVVTEPIDTIDATKVDTSFLGHSYYGDNRSVITDIFELIRRGSSPSDRAGLKPQKHQGAQYWVFSP